MRSIKGKKKASDVTEIMNLIMKVDHEVEARWGATDSHCEKMTGVLLPLFPSCLIFTPPSITTHTVNFFKLTEISLNS